MTLTENQSKWLTGLHGDDYRPPGIAINWVQHESSFHRCLSAFCSRSCGSFWAIWAVGHRRDLCWKAVTLGPLQRTSPKPSRATVRSQA